MTYDNAPTDDTPKQPTKLSKDILEYLYAQAAHKNGVPAKTSSLNYGYDESDDEEERIHVDPIPETGDLTQMLEDLCLLPDMDSDGKKMLHGQAYIMNAMFARTIYRAFNMMSADGAPMRPQFDGDKMNLALRIQKQCAETLRIRAAMEYMQSMTAPTPLPKIKERTE